MSIKQALDGTLRWYLIFNIQNNFTRISDNVWEIPKHFRHDMQVPARIYASAEMLQNIFDEHAIDQLINMTTLPGIEKYALAMPDIHQGYGFPIGGVAAFRIEDGIISPGGVGYDINCGVRLLTSQHSHQEIQPQIKNLINQMQRDVPSGVGSISNLVLNHREFEQVLNTGMKWALQNGFAFADDLESCEENGCFNAADANQISDHARKRGVDQLGTLGAGNHFLEIQEVVEIYDQTIAKQFGIFQGQVTVMIHTGSRGLGHQVCTDYVKLMNEKKQPLKIRLVDRELACAPFNSKDGQRYYQAMAAAANFAWTNRQIITNAVRDAWVKILGGAKNQLSLVYDVAHNIAKIEHHFHRQLVVHRKGATRAFGPNHPELPKKYQTTGQPVLIPGSMGTYSYVLAGTEVAMQKTFGSTCHGAGRKMSRMQSKKTVNYNQLKTSLENYGVTVRCGSVKGLVEEAPQAYKNIDDVIDVVCAERIATKIAKLKPIAVVKG